MSPQNSLPANIERGVRHWRGARVTARHMQRSLAHKDAEQKYGASHAGLRRTSSAVARASSVEERSQTGSKIDMQERMDFLKKDLDNLFNDRGVDESQYDDKVNFMDPITKYNSIKGYMFNIKMLKLIFAPHFQLHDIRQTGDYEATTRWTMVMKPTFNRGFVKRWWDPRLVFTGVSIMAVNPKNGKFNKHIDLWDALEPQNQEFLSREGVGHVFGQLLSSEKTPDLDGPQYEILKKKKQYEIRRYEPFAVAETSMAAASGSGASNPAGDGKSAFNALAGYLFGGNQEQRKMAMTTPVFTANDGKMQFVLGRGEETGSYPAPENAEVQTRGIPGGYFAASRFAGEATEANVAERHAALTEQLQRDGIEFEQERWLLARYNDPSTKPSERRNEVLIPVVDFDLWKS